MTHMLARMRLWGWGVGRQLASLSAGTYAVSEEAGDGRRRKIRKLELARFGRAPGPSYMDLIHFEFMDPELHIFHIRLFYWSL
jgi:hypothetical protein